MKKLLLVTTLALLVLPSTVFAAASVVQDSCVAFVENDLNFAKIHFSLVNFSLPAPVCGLNFEPEPQPVLPECEMVASEAPAGWVTSLKANGGATYGQFPALGCVPAGSSQSGFSFTLDPGFCCYVVKFFDAAGDVLLEQEECFCEKPVQTENMTWGMLKSTYR